MFLVLSGASLKSWVLSVSYGPYTPEAEALGFELNLECGLLGWGWGL